MSKLHTSDYRDYLPDENRPHWTNRKGAPISLSSAAGGVGLLAGLIIGWTTDLRETAPALIGGLVGMLGFDFYWRFVRDVLPGNRHAARAKSAR